MAEQIHDAERLAELQALPLERKIQIAGMNEEQTICSIGYCQYAESNLLEDCSEITCSNCPYSIPYCEEEGDN